MAATGTVSPPSSVPASPTFEWAKIGTDWEADGTTLIASGMLADERYAVGSKIVRAGKTIFTYTINKVFYPDAHIFVGVAEITDDPDCARTWSFSGPTGNLWATHAHLFPLLQSTTMQAARVMSMRSCTRV